MSVAVAEQEGHDGPSWIMEAQVLSWSGESGQVLSVERSVSLELNG